MIILYKKEKEKSDVPVVKRGIAQWVNFIRVELCSFLSDVFI